MKNITNRIFICHKQVNNDTKNNSYSLKGSKILFTTEPNKELIIREDVLTPDYVPERLIGRDEQIKEIL